MSDQPNPKPELQNPTKYLIQTGTQNVFHWTVHLAARDDMTAYDEDILGPVVDGKSSYLTKKAADSAKKVKA
jgi:hypothetical protein